MNEWASNILIFFICLCCQLFVACNYPTAHFSGLAFLLLLVSINFNFILDFPFFSLSPNIMLNYIISHRSMWQLEAVKSSL